MATLAKPTTFGRRGASALMIVSLIALFSLALSALGYVGYVLWPRWPEQAVSPDAPSLPVIVAGTLFSVPPSAIRVAVQRRPGTQDRLDLAFLWPSLAAPDIGPKGPPQTGERVFLTITASGGTLPPTERLKAIYPRYAESQPTPAPDGLAMFAFRDGSPYQGEDLAFDPTTPERFIARCSRPIKQTPGTCLYERRIGDAELIARFPREWLKDWRATADRLGQLIEQIRPRSAS